MLRIIETFGNLPTCFEPTPDVNFQPGNIASMIIKSGKTFVGVCDGMHPCGILDDVRGNVCRCIPDPPAQIHIVPIEHKTYDFNSDKVFLAHDYKVALSHSHIIMASFVSNVDVQLNPINGVVVLPKGIECNYCMFPSPDGAKVKNDAIRFSCRYAYNKFGSFDDSTSGSNRATIWTKHMIAKTDMYDTSKLYSKYNNLYVENGLLTTNMLNPMCACVGFVMEPPSVADSALQFFWDPDSKIDVNKQG